MRENQNLISLLVLVVLCGKNADIIKIQKNINVPYLFSFWKKVSPNNIFQVYKTTPNKNSDFFGSYLKEIDKKHKRSQQRTCVTRRYRQALSCHRETSQKPSRYQIWLQGDKCEDEFMDHLYINFISMEEVDNAPTETTFKSTDHKEAT